jgi:hypothetical protein
MFDEPEDPNESPAERPIDPAQRAREKADEFRMHAELAAVFEGCRKFDAELRPGLDAELARDAQRTVGRLEKAKSADSPILPPGSVPDAAALLAFPDTRGVSTNDYHVYRRPGEVMIARWLAGDQVESFYERAQAHFNAALEGYREEERTTHEWKQDPKTLAYLAALEAVQVPMADRYLRDAVRAHGAFVLSTIAADEMDILHLCDYLMGVDAASLVGEASAPPLEPTEKDRAWFFKLFSLRGTTDGTERMCFFTYMQKADEEESW